MIRFQPPPEVDLGPLHFNSHGLFFLFGALACYLWTRARVPREYHAHIDYAASWMTMGGVIGARLAYVVLNPGLFKDPLELLALWKGGLVSYGGLAGAALAWLVYQRVNGLPGALLNDALGPPALLGWGIGRLGCLLNWTNEFGTVTDVPWAFVVGSDPPRHPVMLYLALAHCLASVGVALLARRLRVRADGLALMAYGAARFVLDAWRFYDPATLLLASRAVCAALFTLGLVIVIRSPLPSPPAEPEP